MVMTNYFQIQFDEQNGAKRYITTVKQELTSRLDKIVLNATLKLQRAIQEEINAQGLVDTGYLKANWVSFVKAKLNIVLAEKGTVGVVSTNTHYAPYLEYGTTNDDDETIIEARKFMEIAWAVNEKKIIAYIETEWKKVIKNAK